MQSSALLTRIGAMCLVLLATPANAQATRTWVSGVGDDANPCSRTAPCKTFAGAISKTASPGEINCLDPAGFGAVTITKAISIICDGVSNGGVLVSGTDGIDVNLPTATSRVVPERFGFRGSRLRHQWRRHARSGAGHHPQLHHQEFHQLWRQYGGHGGIPTTRVVLQNC